eukprot:GHRR01018266.1.p1 GENE.GHRR01018266.1~~GHRR01018266.1.p1  ORF type:complete len:122 (+),score=18.35 GHRR01018266.1:872-1237(+)
MFRLARMYASHAIRCVDSNHTCSAQGGHTQAGIAVLWCAQPCSSCNTRLQHSPPGAGGLASSCICLRHTAASQLNGMLVPGSRLQASQKADCPYVPAPVLYSTDAPQALTSTLCKTSKRPW